MIVITVVFIHSFTSAHTSSSNSIETVHATSPMASNGHFFVLMLPDLTGALIQWTTSSFWIHLLYLPLLFASLLHSFCFIGHFFSISSKEASFSLKPLSTRCLFNSHLFPHFGEGNGNPLQYPCVENPMDRGALYTTVHGVAKSRTRLSDFTLLSFHFPFPLIYAWIRQQILQAYVFKPYPGSDLFITTMAITLVHVIIISQLHFRKWLQNRCVHFLFRVLPEPILTQQLESSFKMLYHVTQMLKTLQLNSH